MFNINALACSKLGYSEHAHKDLFVSIIKHNSVYILYLLKLEERNCVISTSFTRSKVIKGS